MIEKLCEKLIQELGATGLLVLGLYYILYKPLASMAKHIHKINDEIGLIYALMVEESKKKED